MIRPFKLFVYLLLLTICYGLAAAGFKKLYIKDICVQAELAISPEEKSKGLMFRKGLDEDEGMLFIFAEDGLHSFWMKNMQFPLDIIWMDSRKVIVDIKRDVPPCRETCVGLAPAVPSRYVLEVRAGFSEKAEIKVGDKVKF